MKAESNTTRVKLQNEINQLQLELRDATETIEAIRTGQIDALIINSGNGNAIYTLRSADHTYRLFIEKMIEGALTLNREGVILYSNSSFNTMIADHGPVLGKRFTDLVDEISRDHCEELLAKAWERDIRGEVILVSGVPVKISLTELEMDGGTALSIIVTDLSSQKSTQKELKVKNELLESLNEALTRSNTDLHQFASVASHDLQEPLRKIQVFSNLIKDSDKNVLDERSRAYIDKVLLAAQRMKELIDDIMNYSKLTATTAESETVYLGSVVDQVLEDFELRVKEKSAILDVGPLPVVRGNRSQLRQVFQNVISNSLKFSKPGVPPFIRIRTKELNQDELGLSLPGQGYIRISISDNGIGFDQKHSSSIFELFEMLNPKADFAGSGIGLAIAKRILEKHGGFIVAKSSEGSGAEFNIILPVKRLQS